MLEKLKIKLLELLLKNIFKYNDNECREKYLETTLDDITYNSLKSHNFDTHTLKRDLDYTKRR